MLDKWNKESNQNCVEKRAEKRVGDNAREYDQETSGESD
jgi:hypothetical protein